MIVIAVLALPFVFYFNKTDVGARFRNNYGKLYGRELSNLQVERGERLFDLARDLGMIDFLRALVTGGQTEQEVKRQFAVNLLVLRHEAEALGIQPTSEQTVKALSNLRVFRGENGFDLKRYNDVVQNYLGPRGFSEGQLDELAADEIALERIKEMLGAGVNVTDAEATREFEQNYGKIDASVVRVKSADVANEIKISDDEVAKYYESHKADLQSDEKRKVEFASLVLSEDQKKLTGRERVDALQKLADKANDVDQELAKKGADFAAVAAKFQLPVITTGEFTRSAPDPQLNKDSQLVEAAFQLSKEDPTSEPLQGADGFYILHLIQTVPPAPMTLEQARPKIVEAQKKLRERELLSTRASKISHDLQEALKSGATLAAAAQKAGVKLEKVPPFALADEIDAKTPPAEAVASDMVMVKRAVALLGLNEVTPPLPTPDGMTVAIVEKRTAPEQGQANQKTTLADRLTRDKRSIAFNEWLRERRRAAGVVERPAEPPTPS